MNNKGTSVILLLLLATTAVWAQKMGNAAPSVDPFEGRNVRSSFNKIYVGTAPDMVQHLSSYLNESSNNFSNDEVSVELIAQTKSTVSEHYLFRQMYRGYEVFNGDIKLNMDLKGTIRSVFDNSYNTTNWDGNALTTEATALAQYDITEALKAKLGFPNAELETEVVFAEVYGKAFALKKVTLTDNETHAYRLYLVDAMLNVIYQHDLNSYGGAPANATAEVFFPDPVTSAGVNYGAPYVDNFGNDVGVLNNERVSVVIEVDFDTTYYNLANDYVYIDEFSAPTTIAAKTISPTFDFTRGDERFEDVNAYYHLTRYNNYIRDSLGMILGDFQIRYDAHALNGSDNSMYSRSGGIPSLFFGDGGVDDAEDADVIVHEYGHGLSDQAAPSTNFGNERTAIDEGVGDYICSSYSRAITEFRWDDVFTWDGHNEYWSGRSSSVTTCYDPDNLSSSIHTNGQMWSSALMQIWSAIGKINSDKLALQALYNFSSRMTFTDAALAYEEADSLLFGGANYNVIHPIFVSFCFFPGEVGINEISAQKPVVTITNTDGFAFRNEALMIVSDKPIQGVELYDLTGRLVDEQTVNNQQVTNYNVQTRPGVYIINIITDSGSSSHKLVKGN